MSVTITPRGHSAFQQGQRVTVNNSGGAAKAYVPADGLVRQSGTNQGLRFVNHASSATSVVVDYSVDHPELAQNQGAAAQAGVTWVTLGTVAAGAALPDTVGFQPTVIRLTFTGMASVTITCN